MYTIVEKTVVDSDNIKLIRRMTPAAIFRSIHLGDEISIYSSLVFIVVRLFRKFPIDLLYDTNTMKVFIGKFDEDTFMFEPDHCLEVESRDVVFPIGTKDIITG